MRGKPSVWVRARRLEAVRPAAGVEAAVARVAAELGVTPEEVRAGASELAARCREAGATTPEAQTAFLAAELGVTPEELLADAARLAGMDA